MGNSATAYKNQWARENADRVALVLPKGQKAELEEYCKTHGFRFLNEFIKAAIVEAVSSGMAKNDNGEIVFPQEKKKAPPVDGDDKIVVDKA